MGRKNLVVIHLESISWQTLHAFPEAFPNFNRLTPQGRLFRRYFSSATSTQMVLAYLAHGNDFELDAASRLSKPTGNNPSLFSLLKAAGYQTSLLCASAIRAAAMLPLLKDSLPPIWATNDFGALLRKFEDSTAEAPFATYVWNLVTHIEHAAALREHLHSLDDLVGGACAIADHVIGLLLESLTRRGLLDQTTLIVYGDHGDDFWSHGFRGGQMHGVEPYTAIVHAPLLIRDPSWPADEDHRLASTIDILPTCLDLLDLPGVLPFAESGCSLRREHDRICVFSQNRTAGQADSRYGVRKAFSAHDRSHTLLVSSRGLELFNHRLDPTNHSNLLRLFDMDMNGDLSPKKRQGLTHPHFTTPEHYILAEADATLRTYKTLREALRGHIDRKGSFVAAHVTADPKLGLLSFDAVADGDDVGSAPGASEEVKRKASRRSRASGAWLRKLADGMNFGARSRSSSDRTP